MKLPAFLRFLFQRRIIFVSGPPMPLAELQGAFAVDEDDRQFRAALQVIETLEREAIQAAQAAIASHGMCAGFLGGAEWLGLARTKIVGLQQAAQGGSGERN